MSYIQLKDLVFYYKKQERVINGLNLNIEKGEMVAILGANGAGKSTLAKLINGLIECRAGEIIIDNLVLDTKTVYEIRKKIGIVFQNPDNQFVGVTVKDDCAFGMENRCIPQKEMLVKIDEVLKLVKMEDFVNSNPEKLSGGQKQRVAIASVLALGVDIIIFDEATSMLDPFMVKEIIKIIKEIKVDKTIITITHNLEEAKLADRIAILHEGKIIAYDTPEVIFSNVELLETARLDTILEMKLYNELLNKKFPNKEKILEVIWKSAFSK